jgi:flavodoxin I
MGIGIFYGTQTGTTDGVANTMLRYLGDLVTTCKCIVSATADEIAAHDFLILGGATWGDGELTDDWADFWPQMDAIDFTGKTVAIFALGDQAGYPGHFVSSMRYFWDKVQERGGQIVGLWPTEGYEFDHSDAVVAEGYFAGLAIDEINQPQLTEERVAAWCAFIAEQYTSTALAQSSTSAS